MNDQEIIENLELLQSIDLFEGEDSEVILELENISNISQEEGAEK